MTLLIDPPNSAGHGRLWSHLARTVADGRHLASDESYDELHRVAAGLGIPLRGFDRDHYDIPAERYEQVVAAGALPAYPSIWPGTGLPAAWHVARKEQRSSPVDGE